jgi:MarR family transcriptional regulator, transcriptional regulator for hemolysin
LAQVAVAVKKSTANPPDSLEENLCWLLSRAAHALHTQLTAALTELGISPRAHCVLSKAMTGQFTQTALAQKVGLDKTTMVVTIDELEAAGLAERRPAEGDRRARIIAVTKAGKRKVAEGEKIVRETQAGVLDSLPARERARFVAALGQLNESLAEPAPCGPPAKSVG